MYQRACPKGIQGQKHINSISISAVFAIVIFLFESCATMLPDDSLSRRHPELIVRCNKPIHLFCNNEYLGYFILKSNGSVVTQKNTSVGVSRSEENAIAFDFLGTTNATWIFNANKKWFEIVGLQGVAQHQNSDHPRLRVGISDPENDQAKIALSLGDTYCHAIGFFGNSPDGEMREHIRRDNQTKAENVARVNADRVAEYDRKSTEEECKLRDALKSAQLAPLQFSIRTTDDPAGNFTDANKAFANTKVSKTSRGTLVIEFDFDRNNCSIAYESFSMPLLFRLCDINGNVLNHFLTAERLCENKLIYSIGCKTILGYDPATHRSVVLKGVKPVGNILEYPINLRDLRDTEIVVFGFVSQ